MKDIEEVVEYIKENRADEYGNIDLTFMDFGDVNVDVSGMKVGGALWQSGQRVQGDLHQDHQRVQGDLYQEGQRVQGILCQYAQIAKSIWLQDRDGFEQNKDGCRAKKTTLSERLSASDLSDEDKKVLSELVKSSEVDLGEGK